jgi:nitronate monooxygenase
MFRRESRRCEEIMGIPTVLMQRLNLQHPIVQAPMAGGGDTPDLVAAVSNAGGIGFVGAAYSTPEQIAALGRAVREKTARPFGVNLFAPLPVPPAVDNAQAAVERVAPFYAELGLPVPTVPELPRTSFSEQVAACLEMGAAAFSFTFGVLPSDAIAAVKQRGLFLIGTATTVDEALALEKTGVDAIVAQGSEAGGHRGTFLGDFNAAMIGTIALVPQMADVVRVPVIASGGIMDGRGIAAALALGASAVQLGTAFLTCNESGICEGYKATLLDAREDETRITQAFSGRPARGIVNRFMRTVESGDASEAILPFPLQNVLTRPLRTAATKQNRPEYLNLWAGQGVRLARRQSAADLLTRLVAETNEAIDRLRPLRVSERASAPT